MHAMIDIETLGIGHNVPMFELGLKLFRVNEDMNGLGFSFHLEDRLVWHIDLLDVVLSTGFLPQQETVRWWQEQSYDPRVMPRVHLKDALLGLTGVFQKHQVEFVWGNSPSFDLVILEQHYSALGLDKPWNFRMELDYRTIRWLYKTRYQGETPKEVEGLVAHNAADDAEGQATTLIQMLKEGLLNAE